MDFNQLTREYSRLLSLYQSGQMNEQAFKAAVDQLTATDAYGRFWHWDPLSNQWFRFENGQWLRDTPPIQAPPRPAAQPYPPQQPASYVPQPGYVPPAGYAPPPASKSNTGVWIALSAVLGVAVIALIVLLVTGAFNPKPAAVPTTPAVSATPPTFSTSTPPTPSTATPLKALEPTKVPTISLPTATVPKPTLTPTGGLYAYIAPGVHYLLYSTNSSIILVNPDTTTKQLNKEDIVAPDGIKMAVSPRSGLAAFVTSNDTTQMTGMTLHVVRLSDTKEIATIALTNPQTEPGPASDPGDPAYQSVVAITYSNLSWSDDGQKLAFVAGIDGASTDVYLWDYLTLKPKRMSNEPSYAFSARISPDGKNIVYFGATTFGTGAGFSMAGVWVVPASGGPPVELYKPTSSEDFVGWTSSTTFVVQSFSAMCGDHNLRQVNIATKASVSLINTCFSELGRG